MKVDEDKRKLSAKKSCLPEERPQHPEGNDNGMEASMSNQINKPV